MKEKLIEEKIKRNLKTSTAVPVVQIQPPSNTSGVGKVDRNTDDSTVITTVESKDHWVNDGDITQCSE